MGYAIVKEFCEPYKVMRWNPEELHLETLGEFDTLGAAQQYKKSLEERNDNDE